MISPIRIKITQAKFFVRNVRTRMPFRYGAASLQFAPILHLQLTVLTEDGQTSSGVAADVLPPKWFDKDPQKDFRQNVEDLIWSARSACEVNFALSGQQFWTSFGLWQAGIDEISSRGRNHGLNQLTTNHGSSLFERAVIDAMGRAVGLSFHELLNENHLGLIPVEVHAELRELDWQTVFSLPLRTHLWLRHTVGLADPIRTSDISASERLDDGLPQSLEEYITELGIRYFKVKVSGDLESDHARLHAISRLLDEKIPSPYFVSLDGNEQYNTVEHLLELLNALKANAQMPRFLESVRYIEQPFARDVALDDSLRASLPVLTQFRPVLIDESDDHLDAFKHAVALGYRGVSAKNCKGIYKSILNRLLVEHYNATLPDGDSPYFMTGEDLMNIATVPLHQDTAAVSVLGIEHAERNGHHYVRGLDHLSDSEREACLADHASLYERSGGTRGRLRVQDGRIDIRSLAVPGLGVGVATDVSSMVPLDGWTFDSLL